MHIHNDNVQDNKLADFLHDYSENSFLKEIVYAPDVILYDQTELNDALTDSQFAKDPQDEAYIRTVVETMKKRGQVRQLSLIPENFREGLASLRMNFPNFSEVIDYLHGLAEIAWRTDKVMRFTPILLNGPGGVGKTMFSEAVGRWLDYGFHRISISSSQNGAELAGSSSFFSNAKPGVPFTSLVYSETANKIIFLDELEKSSTIQYDVYGVLYVLLEPSTARTFKDQAVPIHIDASHLLYMAACNNAEILPEPLRSRFRQFNIGVSAGQARCIARSIVREKMSALRPATDGMIVGEVTIEVLSNMTPRRMGQALTEAIGNALMLNTLVVDVVANSPPSKHKIGF